MSTINKVTSDALREMAVGETRIFDLLGDNEAQAKAANSGKAIAYRLQWELGCKFTAQIDRVNSKLIITKYAQS